MHSSTTLDVIVRPFSLALTSCLESMLHKTSLACSDLVNVSQP